MKALKLAVAAAGIALVTAAHAQWKPTKPITIIVPWSAGGATDQVTRLAAAELEPGVRRMLGRFLPGTSRIRTEGDST